MSISSRILGVVLFGAVALPLGAQEPSRALVRQTQPYRFVMGRPYLGFSVTTRASDTDSLGARVESVTPGGPAFRGGLRTGDVITRINGQPLVMRAASGIRVPSPGTRLIELAAKLAPEDTVSIQVRRGTGVKNFRLIAEPQQHNVMVYYDQRGQDEQALRELRQRVEEARMLPDRLERDHSRAMLELSTVSFSPLGSLQLAPLNDDLGRYFGTSEGVLVISVPANSPLSLRGGDVVLRVDGREPENPGHLLRILGSYGPGESLSFDIYRDRKRRTVKGTVAAARGVWTVE